MNADARVGRGWLSRRPRLRGAIRLAVIAFALWWILTEGAGDWFAALAVTAAAVYSGLRWGPGELHAWRPWQLTLFLGWFIRQSLRGGVDVSLRACRRRMRIDPCLVERHTNLPPGQPRTLFVAVMSLLPGTLAADMVGDRVRVHLLSPEMAGEVDALEARVARLFQPAVEAAHE